jgi:uncharacterized RDD family membrane protein YckC
LDQSAIFGGPLAAEPVKPPTRHFAGFWRRAFAFVVDGILISIPSFLLGYVFYDFFSSSSAWAAVVGFAITLPYFAIMGSSVGNGQTLGQRWAGIEVVDGQGNHLPKGKSALRYAVLLIPFLFGEEVLPSYLAWLTGMAGATIFYLYLFNTPTRRTLHDLATGSFVVETPGIGTIDGRRVWPGHWAILGGLGVLGMVLTPVLTRTGPFPELLAVQRAILDSGKYRSVSVMLQTVNPGSTTGLRLTVTCKNQPKDYEKAGSEIVAIIEKTDPQAVKLDFISVDFREGFRVGLATFSNAHRQNHSPQQWEEIQSRTNQR